MELAGRRDRRTSFTYLRQLQTAQRFLLLQQIAQRWTDANKWRYGRETFYNSGQYGTDVREIRNKTDQLKHSGMAIVSLILLFVMNKKIDSVCLKLSTNVYVCMRQNQFYLRHREKERKRAGEQMDGTNQNK